MLNELINIGFVRIGSWDFKNGNLLFSNDNSINSKNALYSFAIGNTVKYIGKTTNTIEKRLNQYAKPHSTQRTNYRVNENIINELLKGSSVEIYVFISNEKVDSFGIFNLNVSAGLEDSIIHKLNPDWNSLGGVKNNNMIDIDTNGPNEEETREMYIISMWQTVLDHRKLNYSRAKSCEIFCISDEELTQIEIEYNELTGN